MADGEEAVRACSMATLGAHLPRYKAASLAEHLGIRLQISAPMLMCTAAPWVSARRLRPRVRKIKRNYLSGAGSNY